MVSGLNATQGRESQSPYCNYILDNLNNTPITPGQFLFDIDNLDFILKVELEVDQATGSTNLLEADPPTFEPM